MRNDVSPKGKGELPDSALPLLTPRKITATTATTATELAREFDSLHVILCLAEVYAFFVKNDVLAVHPDPQGRLSVALLASTEPHAAVLLAGEF